MDSGKQQAFPYSLRTIAVGNGSMCNNRYHLTITPPQNALTIENLWTHFVMQFDVSVATGKQVLQAIGITNNISTPVITPSYHRYLTLNQAADGNRRIDINLDLSGLLQKTNPSCGIDIILADALNGVFTIGVLELWKADGLYTTIGIR